MAGGLDPASREALRKLPDAIVRDALRELEKAARDTAAATRAAILAAPSRHPGTLRADIAKTVRARTRLSRSTGGSVIVESLGRKMPAGEENLPGYADGSKPRWRHPTFGHDPWKDQAPIAPGWFYGTARARRDSFIRAAEKGMQRAADHGGR